MTVDHVRAAHEGLLEQELVYGTLTFGYGGVELPGQITRQHKPRRRLVTDPIEAKWVQRVFGWYTGDGLTIGECIRRLNHEQAPLPPRCATGQWTRQAVRLLLANPRYRGIWAYGRSEARYLAKQDYVRQFPREQPLKTQQIERLRIVDDETWFRAQALLAKEAPRCGRKARCVDQRRRPNLLPGPPTKA